ncbi:uncharacterized protein LOC125946007 [Dermacentor silvarum]|uniref:uncharacterized protein LOC125946007 n=1 Tax=Dermacentor silvarum TaxID=543639 RepID=UPI002101BD92|nr:uncharacterized protein LOC125946007 [Dermacentor silvarum]XP_049524434.1 uncharacterized protein LOC125946007 [Dermacentor silvarum]
MVNMTFWPALVLLIMTWNGVEGQNDSSTLPTENQNKVEEVRKMVNGTESLVILLRTNWPPRSNNTRCWMSKKNYTGLAMPQHHLRYQQQVKNTQETENWQRRTLTALYIAGLRSNIVTFAMFTYDKQMKLQRETIGYFFIIYAKRPCFVLQSQEDTSSCMAWVTRKTITENHDDCIKSFNSTCVQATTTVHKYAKSICKKLEK